ncbi:MAG: hypothetical protein ABSA46_02810 [Thermodesulfovibrionales bacterium]
MESINYERDVEHSESTYHMTDSFKDTTCVRRIPDDVSALQQVKRVVIRN